MAEKSETGLLTKIRSRLGFKKKEQAVEVEVEPVQIADSLAIHQFIDPHYRQYRCSVGDPLSCGVAYTTVQQDSTAKHCLQCGFPATLIEKTEIRGRRGNYRIEGLLGRRGLGRLYKAIQLSDHQPVILKEYLLPGRCFNQEEMRERQQAFERLAGVSLADGRVQDIRLITPWDAIADPVEERCYLVTKTNLDAYPTLSTYLGANGPMTGGQVRQVLNQVLQTLEFLHGQKFSLPSGQVQQGVVHGNINLHSLLIATDAREFFIYVSDLALWEHLFELPNTEILQHSAAQDLVALGYVSFYLLMGRSIDPVSGQPLDPRDEQYWLSIDPALKAFILRLLAIDVAFPSAEEARQVLLKLPPELPPNGLVVQGVAETDPKKKSRRLLWFILLGGVGLLLLILLLWSLLSRRQTGELAEDEVLLCCMKDVSAVPTGRFTYSAEQQGIWSYIRRFGTVTARDKTIEDKLRERQPKLEINYQPAPSAEEAIVNVRSEKVDFAVTSLMGELTAELQPKKIAYDGLVVFVAFSYANRDKSLPQALQGKITFEQLRQLYTGKITNWKQLNGPDLRVRLYMPPETEAIRIFEQRVLKDEYSIGLFRSLWKKDSQSVPLFRVSQETEITPLRTFDTLQRVLQDFESKNLGGIAFGSLSKVVGQCSVYPLALVEGEKRPVQVLVQDNGNPVNPTTDLCDNKGSYRPNVQVFKNKSYPLGYPIVVVSPRDNSRPPVGEKFADLLRTHEGQRLLSKAGLIPLQPIPRE